MLQNLCQQATRPEPAQCGVMCLGDTMTWEAVHFGITQHLTTKITAYERPQYFIDEMTRGIFQELRHHHAFVPQASGTLMSDTFAFRDPIGLLGRVVEALILTRYLRGLLLTTSYARETNGTAQCPLVLPHG
jgi:ligand-binding SRPBCC domain-containing protein